MVFSWLKKQRKAELTTLAGLASLQIATNALKPDIVEALAEHLDTHEAQFRNNPHFQGYYTRAQRTPGPRRTRNVNDDEDEDEDSKEENDNKDEEDGEEDDDNKDDDDDRQMKSSVHGRGKRRTPSKSKSDLESEDNDKDMRDTAGEEHLQGTAGEENSQENVEEEHLQNTATRLRYHLRQSIAMQRSRWVTPPSPTVVVDEVEHATARFYAGLEDMYTLSGLPEVSDWARDKCSSLAAVHVTFLLVEVCSLLTVILPWWYAFDLPAIRAVGLPSYAVKIPDILALLTPEFWRPIFLWSSVNVLIPLTFAYFFNLTVHTVRRNNARVRVVRYNYDPFTFNVAKSLLVSTVYGGNILHGYVSDHTVHTVEDSTYGGMSSMLMGCYVCGLYSLWQAMQRR